jgi:hypothetical protein
MVINKIKLEMEKSFFWFLLARLVGLNDSKEYLLGKQGIVLC